MKHLCRREDEYDDSYEGDSDSDKMEDKYRDSTRICITERKSSHHLALVIIY